MVSLPTRHLGYKNPFPLCPPLGKASSSSSSSNIETQTAENFTAHMRASPGSGPYAAVPLGVLSCPASRGSLGGGIFRSEGSTCQMSRAYSLMVRSLENLPAAAMFLMTILVQALEFCEEKGWGWPRGWLLASSSTGPWP